MYIKDSFTERELELLETIGIYLHDGEYDDFEIAELDDIVVDNYPIKAILIPCPHSDLEFISASSPEVGKDGNEAYFPIYPKQSH